jgi:hypothetical protein
VARSKTNEFDSNSSNLKQINAVVQKNSKRFRQQQQDARDLQDVTGRRK